MASIDTDSTDVRQLAAQLVRAGEAVVDLEATNREAAQAWLDGLRPPTRSGQLAAAVRADWSTGGWRIAYLVAYAVFVHWGAPRRNIVARPWLVEDEPARVAKVTELYADHIETSIETNL